ncbi:hypothetical protein [Streptomyces sp. NPDC060035]
MKTILRMVAGLGLSVLLALTAVQLGDAGTVASTGVSAGAYLDNIDWP